MELSELFYKHARADERLVISQGGTSAGKSYCILQLIINIAYKKQNEALLFSVVSESLPHLRRGVMRDFLKILMDDGMYTAANHNKTNNSYKIGKCVIEFFGADQPDKLRGARRDYLFINECNNIAKSAFDQLEVRTKYQIWLDFNPVSEFWVHEHILPLDGVKFIKSTYKDNPFLDEQIVKAIERREFTDPEWWRVYGLGEVGNVEGVIFNRWKPVDEFPKECKWVVYGLDFGYTNDPSAIVRIGLKEGELYLEEMLHETGLTNIDLIKKMEDLGIGKNEEIYADSAEPKSIETIRRSGYFIRGAVKGKDSINNGIDTVKQYELNVTKNSVNLIKELRNYKWMVKGDATINKPIDNWNHCIDALRYGVIMKCKNRNNILAIGIS